MNTLVMPFVFYTVNVFKKLNNLKICIFFFAFFASSAGLRVRGWFPRRCVEKCHYDSANNTSASEEKKDK